MGALWELIEEYRRNQPYEPSVAQVGAKAGMNRGTLNRWQDVKRLPEREHLEAMARVLGRPYHVLLDAALRDAGYLGESEASSDAAAIGVTESVVIGPRTGNKPVPDTQSSVFPTVGR